MSTADPDLGDLLAKVLPADVKVTIRHISSAPTPCDALFAAPPGEEPETTFCENHFLSASINVDEKDGQEVIIFGIEALVYSAANLTTIFVSKADSTGYLHLLKDAPKVSLLRLISNTFLSFLVRTRQRPGVRLVVSLFARAQNQYLFPGSIDNAGKHVLDDRGLIKWWCRAVDPILREYEPESGSQEKGLLDRAMESAKSSATAFLIVPGCDRFETRGFFPGTAKTDNKDRPRWCTSYPIRQLCKNSDAPPRCLIPRFPDDPKTRFLIDLDDELPELTEKGAQGGNAGQWRSVRSLDQFWEMMSFRQECSAGRLVGFLWLVINPPGLENSVQMASSRFVQDKPGKEAIGTASAESKQEDTAPAAQSEGASADSTHQPEFTEKKGDEKPDPASQPTNSSEEQPRPAPLSDSQAFSWPEAGRGHAVLNEADYKTVHDFLLMQDFDNLDASIASTKEWAEKVASVADQLLVGQIVIGKNTAGEFTSKPVETHNLISSGLVRKRKKNDAEDHKDKAQGSESKEPQGSTEAGNENSQEPTAPEQPPAVNLLNANLVRKKKKT